MLDRIVHIVQIITAVLVAAFVILLFVNEPAQLAPVLAAGSANAGATLYSTAVRRATVRTVAQLRPALGGGVAVGRFPNAADQITVVSQGRDRCRASPTA